MTSTLPATRTACIKGRRDELGPDLTLAPTGYTYVGRGCFRGRWQLKHSPFHNPFSISRHGRAGSLERFRDHLRAHPELVARIRRELQGKVLCCWCRNTHECHAPILASVADGAEP